jgi:hypothetical protein
VCDWLQRVVTKEIQGVARTFFLVGPVKVVLMAGDLPEATRARHASEHSESDSPVMFRFSFPERRLSLERLRTLIEVRDAGGALW